MATSTLSLALAFLYSARKVAYAASLRHLAAPTNRKKSGAARPPHEPHDSAIPSEGDRIRSLFAFRKRSGVACPRNQIAYKTGNINRLRGSMFDRRPIAKTSIYGSANRATVQATCRRGGYASGSFGTAMILQRHAVVSEGPSFARRTPIDAAGRSSSKRVAPASRAGLWILTDQPDAKGGDSGPAMSSADCSPPFMAMANDTDRAHREPSVLLGMKWMTASRSRCLAHHRSMSSVSVPFTAKTSGGYGQESDQMSLGHHSMFIIYPARPVSHARAESPARRRSRHRTFRNQKSGATDIDRNCRRSTAIIEHEFP